MHKFMLGDRLTTKQADTYINYWLPTGDMKIKSLL